MRKAEFIVPQHSAVEFADAMLERELKSSITGTTQDEELVIEVEYEKNETDQVDELEEILDKLRD